MIKTVIINKVVELSYHIGLCSCFIHVLQSTCVLVAGSCVLLTCIGQGRGRGIQIIRMGIRSMVQKHAHMANREVSMPNTCIAVDILQR